MFKGLIVYELTTRVNKGGGDPQPIDKPPFSELHFNQKDSDTLLHLGVRRHLSTFVEGDIGIREIIANSYDANVVVRVAQMVNRNKYKRRQSAPGSEDHDQGFRQGPQTPITNRYRPTLP